MSAITQEPRIISQRELRNQSAAIMNGLEAGEAYTITRNGHPVGQLLPITGPRESVPTAEFMAACAGLPRIDYAQMRAEMDEFFGDHDEISPDDDPSLRSSRIKRPA